MKKDEICERYELEAIYCQDPDGNDPNIDEIQELNINVEDCGGGDYFVIKTDRWAFDTIEDLIDLLQKFKTKHEKIK